MITIYLQFTIFALILLGIIFYHKHSLLIATGGTVMLLCFTVAASYLQLIPSFSVIGHVYEHGHLLINIFALLLGFTLLAKLFETSGAVSYIHMVLPNHWIGAFLLLLIIFLLSAILDNIACAILGVVTAKIIFKDKLHLGYLVAIVGASNAGGAGSVIGDTTTTMLWISGIPPLELAKAFLPAFVALFIFGLPLSYKQYYYQAMSFNLSDKQSFKLKNILGVAFCIVCIFIANLWDLPGLGLWMGLGLCAIFISLQWSLLKDSYKEASFLCLLIISATVLPTNFLPPPTVMSTLLVGVLSAFFDNIPLTSIAIKQGIQDWGLLSFSLGFGGSMMWFGSSAGVAVSSLLPEAKNSLRWMLYGSLLFIAFLVGCAIYLIVFGFEATHVSTYGVIQ
ncbi:MAG: hypothetical protein QM538_02935 [Methylacidiphilales bacterium]|nr:hypothetical protein [Candidatus Methylacidiphilales bacterium]